MDFGVLKQRVAIEVKVYIEYVFKRGVAVRGMFLTLCGVSPLSKTVVATAE